MITKEQVTFRKEAVDNFSYKHICTYTVTTVLVDTRYADEEKIQDALLLMLYLKVFGRVRLAFLSLYQAVLGQKRITKKVKTPLFRLSKLLP